MFRIVSPVPLPLLVTLLTLMLCACGHKEGTPAYNIEKNAANFPEKALDLIRDVEGKRLETYDQVVAAFEQLYAAHSELLDNTQWQEVVSRLGLIFRERGDDLARSGVHRYADAREFYALASFARPEDDRTREQLALFGLWETAASSGIIPERPTEEWIAELPFQERLMLIREFYYRDMLHREFVTRHLVDRLLPGRQQIASYAASGEFSLADSLLLAHFDRFPASDFAASASFGEQGIDLLGIQFLYRGINNTNHQYVGECYFRPAKKIARPFLVSLNLHPAYSPSAAAPLTAEYHFEFVPEPAPQEWRPGKIALAVCTLWTVGPIDGVRISLVEKDGARSRYLPIRGTDAHEITRTPSFRMWRPDSAAQPTLSPADSAR